MIETDFTLRQHPPRKARRTSVASAIRVIEFTETAPPYCVGQLVAWFQGISPDHGLGPGGRHAVGDEVRCGLFKGLPTHVKVEIRHPAQGAPETPLRHQQPVDGPGEETGFEE